MTQRILAVDDQVHILKLIERMIRDKTPYVIYTTNNSLEVPKILEEDEFDLLLTDLCMPGMDGLDLLRMIKEQGRPEEVILMTAFASLESVTEALSLGALDYITKPFKKEQLIASVQRAMTWQQQRRDAATLHRLLEQEPFAEARRGFEEEYLRSLQERYGGNQEVMLQRARLTPEQLPRKNKGD